MRFLGIIVFSAFFTTFTFSSLWAKNFEPDLTQRNMMMNDPNMGQSSDPEISFPYIANVGEVYIDTDQEPPFEPNIIKVDYLPLSQPRDLRERVGRLVQGITIDIPPEYDHYGYEMRRYMNRVGNLKIYTDPAFLKQQRVNVNKAAVVLDYWRKHIKKEIVEIDPLVQKDNVQFATRTAYRQNLVKANNFLSLAASWVETNKNFLEYLDAMQGKYSVEYPMVLFKDEKSAKKFQKLLKKRQEAVIELRTYTIFRFMVY